MTDRFGDDFFERAGELVDNVVQSPGDQSRLQLNVNLPLVDVGMASASIGFEFVALAERDDGGVKLGCQLGLNFIADVDLWLVEAFAEARIFGYIEAYGDGGAECFRLMILALERRLRDVSGRAADAVFDQDAVERSVDDMDSDDYVESGLGASLTAGFGVGDDGPSAEASLERRSGTRLTEPRRGDDEPVEREIDTTSCSVSVSAGGFSLTGEVCVTEVDGRFDEVGLTCTGETDVPLAQISRLLGAGDFLHDLYGQLADTLEWAGGILGSEAPLRTLAGELAMAPVNWAIDGATEDALRRLTGQEGPNVSHGLSVEISHSRSAGFALEIRLERLHTIEFGGARDRVHVEYQDLETLFQVQVP